jgi:hypothetical protein
VPDHQHSPPEQLAAPGEDTDIEASFSSALTAELSIPASDELAAGLVVYSAV